MNWYGHVQRMDEERLTRKFWNGDPPGRRNSWMQEVTTGMREREREELTTSIGLTKKG